MGPCDPLPRATDMRDHTSLPPHPAHGLDHECSDTSHTALESQQRLAAPDAPSRISAIVSPEVISSLISSLAAISSPTERYFDTIVNASDLDTYPSRPADAPVVPRVPDTTNDIFGMATVTERNYSLRNFASGGPHVSPRGSRDQSLSPNSYHPRTNALRPQVSGSSTRSDFDESQSIGVPSIGPPHRSSNSSLASSMSKCKTNGGNNSEQTSELNTPIQEDISTLAGSGEFLGATQSLHDPSESKENLPPKDTPRPFSLLQLKTQNSPGQPASNSESPINSSPGLGNHLIPSRHSSLRINPSDGPKPRDSKRFSTSSRDLKDLNIDQDLIAEDHSTVRRIRELQEAKEKRMSEWHKDGRKPERQKRNSAPSPKSLHKMPSRHSTQSVVGIVMEVPEKDVKSSKARTPSPDARDPARDTTKPSRRSSLLLKSSPAPQKTPSSPSTSARHRRALSSTLKRSITTNSSFLDTSELGQAAIDEEVESFLGSPRFTQKIKHPRTGRTIAFSQMGDLKGFPVICCVGMGLTRYVTGFYDELAKSLKLRLITPDRPGIGESEACQDSGGTPLGWADDVYVLCSVLDIAKFSLIAHSAGAIYALAVALRLPQHVRGRLHLLAPWIPPSQLASMTNPWGASPAVEMPFGQRLLSVLPSSFLKIANASFMSATSASISPRARSKRKSAVASSTDLRATSVTPDHKAGTATKQEMKPAGVSCYQATTASLIQSGVINTPTSSPPSTARFQPQQSRPSLNVTSLAAIISPEQRRTMYNETLTHRIWELATTNANPAVDLLVCLERRAPIGFKYTDITRAVVVHHGAQDTRVPVENVKLLEKAMPRCELRVLPDDGHGLMASASVMAGVLTEIEKEWSEYEKVVAKGGQPHSDRSNERGKA